MTAGIIVGGSVLIFTLIVGAMWVFGGRAKQRLAAQYPPPGQMVDVGGYRMHIHCQGHVRRDGGPTVVLDTGLGEPALTWGSMPRKVAEFARVCTYDRAGLGWSEPSPKPRIASHVVGELRTLLTRAHVAPPYVLVGHSIGGLYACVYAHEHPDEVAGLVLLDGAHEEHDLRQPEAVAKLSKLTNNASVWAFRLFRMLNSVGLMALMRDTVSKMWWGAIPDETREVYIGLACSGTGAFEAMAREAKSIWDCMDEFRAMRVRSLGDLPLVVVSRGRPAVSAGAGVSAEDAEQFEAMHRDMQAELAARSSRGKHIIAEASGHYVHLGQPELVIAAIREVVEAAQAVDGVAGNWNCP